jgi:hypothetical protein
MHACEVHNKAASVQLDTNECRFVSSYRLFAHKDLVCFHVRVQGLSIHLIS